MAKRYLSRREYALAVGAAASAGVSGCSSPFDDTDDSPEQENGGQYRSEFPSLSADEPAFREWIPADEREELFVAVYNVAKLRENRAKIPAETYESVAGWPLMDGYIGIEFDEIETFLPSLELEGNLYTISVSASTVIGRLEQTPYEQFDQQGSVTYFRDSRDEAAVLLAVSDGGVISGRAGPDETQPTREFLENSKALVETATGNRERLVDDSDLYAQYTSEMGQPLFVATSLWNVDEQGITPDGVELDEEMEQSLHSGVGRYLTADAIIDRNWLRVNDDASVSAKRLEEIYRDAAAAEAFENYNHVAIRRDGQVVDLALFEPIETPGGGVDPPLVSVDISITDTTAIIAHLAGDPLPLDRVTVQADDEIKPGSGALLPGEQIRVDIGESEGLELVYESPSGEDTSRIAEYEQD